MNAGCGMAKKNVFSGAKFGIKKVLLAGGYDHRDIDELLTEELVREYQDQENLRELKKKLDAKRNARALSGTFRVTVDYGRREFAAKELKAHFVPANYGMFGRDDPDYGRVSRETRELEFCLRDKEDGEYDQKKLLGRRAILEELMAFVDTHRDKIAKGTLIVAEGSLNMKEERHGNYSIAHPGWLNGKFGETNDHIEYGANVQTRYELRVHEAL